MGKTFTKPEALADQVDGFGTLTRIQYRRASGSLASHKS
jgi:hypothetical protein